MELFDTHFHFSGDAAPAEFMARIRGTLAQQTQFPVERLSLLAMGGDYAESLRAQSFAQAVPEAYCAVGVHPHQAEEYEAKRSDFSVFHTEEKLRAIGELGLDYYYGISAVESQKRVFAEFLELALAWELPAVVHLRDQAESEAAYADAWELLAPFAARGGRFVVHCYAGNAAYLEKFLEAGAYIGVTGMATFRKAENIRGNLKKIPLERLLLETDSPYLAPVPHRGEENQPGFLPLIAACAAEVCNMPVEKIAELTTRNARRFLRLEEEK